MSGTGAGTQHDVVVTTTGTLYGCLTGTGANFNLYLKKLNSAGGYTEVARSTGATSTESITFAAATPGTYRWRILSSSGGGGYTLKAAGPG